MVEKVPPLKRGRPARLSREQVLQAALKLLEKGPAEVTLNGVARALGVAPMSLYTHIRNRDDLLHGVSQLVLGQLQLRLDAAGWQAKVRQWVQQVQSHFALYPQIARLLGESEQVPSQWLRLQAELIEVLEQAGLSGTDLSSTANLLGQALTFDCLRGSTYQQGINELVEPVLPELCTRDRRSIELVLRSAPSSGHSLLEFVLEQLLQRAEVILQQGRSKRPSG